MAKTGNGGVTWVQQASPIGSVQQWSVSAVDKDTAFFGGGYFSNYVAGNWVGLCSNRAGNQGWNVAPTASFQPGGHYQVQSWSVDKAGNPEVAGPGSAFTYQGPSSTLQTPGGVYQRGRRPAAWGCRRWKC
jgi:hypothetical protein